jgi:hypothetical protein
MGRQKKKEWDEHRKRKDSEKWLFDIPVVRRPGHTRKLRDLILD